MSTTETKADIYVMALQALSKRERAAVIARLLDDPGLRENILDVATIRRRQNEPSRPFRDYLKTRVKSSR